MKDAGNKLVSALHKQTGKVVYFCEAENISPNLAVHEIRKSFKRIRALLKFYPVSYKQFPLDHLEQIITFGRELSALRESFVNIQVFEKITEKNDTIPAKKRKAVKVILVENNRRLLEAYLTKKPILPDIDAFINSFDKKLTSHNFYLSGKGFISVRLNISYHRAYSHFFKNSGEYEPTYFHELRKRLKILWYEMEYVKFINSKYFKQKATQLNNITEQLGEVHDYFVLQTELQREEYSLDEAELVIIEKKIQHFQELNHRKLFPRLKQFFNEPPEAFHDRINLILLSNISKK